MPVLETSSSAPAQVPTWRYALLIILMLAPPALIMSLGPIAQIVSYHDFADSRGFVGIPNFADVATNLPFLLIGLYGLRFCASATVGNARSAWLTMFAGIALVSVGSMYYHWNPNNSTLVWDRLAMSMGFMGLFVALLGEYLAWEKSTVRIGIFAAVLFGAASVVYWYITDDLGPFIWVQLAPLLAIPTVMFLLPHRHTQQGLLLVGLGLYVLAKLVELFDQVVFASLGGLVSGHSLKHLLSGIACYCVLLMLQTRKPLSRSESDK